MFEYNYLNLLHLLDNLSARANDGSDELLRNFEGLDAGHVGLQFSARLSDGVGDAVEDVQGQPAEGEEEEDEGQRLGDLQLLPIVLLRVSGGGRHLLVELLADQIEDLHVDEDHEQQRGQHPHEEVEIDHVLHADDLLELALNHRLAHAAVGQPVPLNGSQVVPAEHGCQAHHKGENPAASDGHNSPSRSHHCLVPDGEEGRV